MKNLTLSLDISTTATGWAVFHGSDLVQSGVLKHKSKSFFILGYDFEECFELAYQEIKDRKGRWIDGSFVKEEDLV